MSQKIFLYNMVPIDEKCDCVKSEYDYFFLAGGSDVRAYELLKRFEKNNILLNKIFLFDFIERKPLSTNQTYYSYKSTSYNIQEIECSIMDPASCFKLNNQSNFKIEDNSNIAIDISCFTKPYFFYILHLGHLSG